MVERDYSLLRFSVLGLIEEKLISWLFSAGYNVTLDDRNLSVERYVFPERPYRPCFVGTQANGFSGFYIPPRSCGRHSHRKIVPTRNVNFRNRRKNPE